MKKLELIAAAFRPTALRHFVEHHACHHHGRATLIMFVMRVAHHQAKDVTAPGSTRPQPPPPAPIIKKGSPQPA